MARRTKNKFKKEKVDSSLPLSKRYRRCKKTDLAIFARSRGVQVANTSQKPESGPTNRDYVRALEEADRNMTFRFLDMAPELRNIIYKELLVMRNCWYCFPQILATSKEIKREASSILYGDNLYEVRIRADGVFAHGYGCGRYKPVHELHDFRSLEWPRFLRRVHHLRVGIVELPAQRGRVASLSNILASLCTFLGVDHQLVSLHLDLEWLPSHGIVDGVEATLYPLHLLGPSPQITVTGFDEAVTAMLLAQSPLAHTTRYSLVYWSGVRELRNCARTYADLTSLVRPRLSRRDREPPHLLQILGAALLTRSQERLRKDFLNYVDHPRVRYEQADPRRLTAEMRTRVEDILRKGIDQSRHV